MTGEEESTAMSDLSPALTMQEFGALIDKGKTTIYRLIKDGLLHPVYYGSTPRFPQAEVARFLREGTKPTVDRIGAIPDTRRRGRKQRVRS